jgi:membrane protein DedA with SNARE-associated domain
MNELIREYGYLAVFLLAGFDHSGTPLGLLLSIGFVTTGELALLPTLIIVTLGGIFGDIVLFSIGYFGGSRALNWFKGKSDKIKNSIEKAEVNLHKYGSVFLVWGKFITLVGRYMGLVYGAIKYKLPSFIFFSTIGSILMTLAYGLPMYFLGSKANEYFQNQHLTLYLTLGVIFTQLLVTYIWIKRKKG